MAYVSNGKDYHLRSHLSRLYQHKIDTKEQTIAAVFDMFMYIPGHAAVALLYM